MKETYFLLSDINRKALIDYLKSKPLNETFNAIMVLDELEKFRPSLWYKFKTNMRRWLLQVLN